MRIVRTYHTSLLLGFIVVSCVYNDGDWGATTGNCDEICTVYYTAQLELFKSLDLNDRDFPAEELRRNHVQKIADGYQIASWYNLVNEAGDTVKTNFSCEVHYDPKNTKYIVENLVKFKPQDCP